eukprot:3259622-Alexandrium_andersonii.AAC.1
MPRLFRLPSPTRFECSPVPAPPRRRGGRTRRRALTRPIGWRGGLPRKKRPQRPAPSALGLSAAS